MGLIINFTNNPVFLLGRYVRLKEFEGQATSDKGNIYMYYTVNDTVLYPFFLII